METLEHNVKELKEDVKMLAKNINNIELVLQLMDKDTETWKEDVGYEKDTMKCTMCKYRCEKAITMKKHMNTKHDQVSYKCNEYSEEFHSNDALAVHMSKEHEKDHSDKLEYSGLGKQASHVPDMKECPLCEESFLTDEEFNIHINEHLTEIKSMSIEYLKNGH